MKSTRFKPTWARSFALAASALAALAVFLASACGEVQAPVGLAAQQDKVVGQCARDQVKLHGPAIDCVTDHECPCGSYCKATTHTCGFDCNIPPAGVNESCSASAQCDDTGRCVLPGVSLPPPGVLTADPSSLTTTAGGAAKSFAVKLRVPEDNAARRSTTVRVTGRDGAQVSCDATTFGNECTLTAWSFSLAVQGPSFLGTKTVFVRTAAGNQDGKGDVMLQIDRAATQLVVSAASSPATSLDGNYGGVAVSAAYPDGISVTAVIDATASIAVVRDANRIIAPDGALVLDFRTTATTDSRKLVWLRGVGAPSDAGAIVGTYRADPYSTSSDGTISVPFTITINGVPASWTLKLIRISPAAPECVKASDCGSGNVCPFESSPSAVKICVPEIVWTSQGTLTPGNQLDDARSLQWWNALSALIGTTNAGHAFGVYSGASKIETLMCTTSDTSTNAGQFGRTQLQQGGGPSLSGDLACVNGSGQPNFSPGAVGLVTYRDRHGNAESGTLLDLCLGDMGRSPTSGFAANYGDGVGECINLARFLPAIRMLATGELRGPQIGAEPRARALFLRLLQQWSVLHGFLASTGLSARELDDALAASTDEARTKLLRLLDVLDGGWGALLDRRIADQVTAAVSPTWVNSAHDDYRTIRAPAVYWPINFSADLRQDLRPFDLIHNATLVSQPGPSGPNCPINGFVNQAFVQWHSCPGLQSDLPSSTRNISDGHDLSVFLSLNQLLESRHDFGCGFPPCLDITLGVPYLDGTWVVTPTLAIGEKFVSVSGIGHRDLVLMHPTAPGGGAVTETVVLSNLDPWWPISHNPSDFRAVMTRGMSFAIVRDTAAQTYTVYLYDNWRRANFQQIRTVSYSKPVVGTLPWLPSQRVLIGAANTSSDATDPWAVGNLHKSFFGEIDDVAIFDRGVTRPEFLDFATQRNNTENLAVLAPAPLADNPTQEINVPLGAEFLETQAAHLDVAARLIEHMRYEAQVACETDSAPSAKADIDAIVARVGRTLRQSSVVEGMAVADTSARANDARKLLSGKRAEIVRDLLPLTSCTNPYGMAEDEVPLYHGDPDPRLAPSAAFFAASDHLIQLAQTRVTEATTALQTVRDSWERARQSKIQELQDSNSRAIRVEEVQKQYGDALLRLCGIGDKTPAQVLAAFKAGQLSVETCYRRATSVCSAASVLDADQSCFQGVIGVNLMEMRSALAAQRAAYQNWQAAIANSAAQQRLCIQKQIDLKGCQVSDRHLLTGVVCPPGFKGTEELVEEYHEAQHEAEEESHLLDEIGAAIHGGFEGAAAGPVGVIAGALAGTLLTGAKDLLSEDINVRKNRLDEELARRANDEAIQECWAKVLQFAGAAGVAEQGWIQAGDQFGAATISYQSSLSEARQAATEGPVVLDLEQTRPSIPIAFHYWVPEAIEAYRTAMNRARRYAYLALRATEYDTMTRYLTASTTRPSRSAIVTAWRPASLQEQLNRMKALTDTRTTPSGPPVPGFWTFDVGAKFFGLANGNVQAGSELDARVRPVFSRTTGAYLGQGLRFALLPKAIDEAPVLRCAERIWRVNFGSSAFPSPRVNEHHVKLLKGSRFASRLCDQPGFQVATHRDEVNLFLDDGEQLGSLPETLQASADLSVVNFDLANNLTDFQESDAFTNGSSTELALQGLYGEYILLIPQVALDHGVVMSSLHDLALRFDFISVDNTPPVSAVAPGGTGTVNSPPIFEIDRGTGPIFMDTSPIVTRP